MKRIILAFEFLTSFPIGRKEAVLPHELGRSMAYFPFVGLVQGAILVIADSILGHVLPTGLTSVLILGILILTNNGLHLDGFVDTVDGLAGGKTKQERLSIMRDHRIGALGAAGLVFLLLVKYEAIASFSGDARRAAIFLFPIIGRWAMVPMAYWSDYAREDEGQGKAFTRITIKTLSIATFLAFVFSTLLIGIHAITMLFIMAVSVWLITWSFKRKIGGVTGDVFGFQSEVAEALFLALMLAMANHQGVL
ncbi:MAG: adenosylcobinamide-GDP ribazoletransferase [Deltaproteobacteria bacterium]|nr:adenosylcobinamide-GDP ribazoletransferase [Deltaproteobacteria bacterium]